MVKNALVGPKNNHMAKNEVGMGTVSGVAHKISKLFARKMIKGTQLNFRKRCFMELNCLAIKRHRRI